MRIGMIGLGRMGLNMTTRLIQDGHQVVGFALSPESVAKAVKVGAEGAESLQALVAKLEAPRIVWIMVPSGEPTQSTIEALAEMLEAGDVVVDGGNSFYKDTLRRAEFLAEKNIEMVDVGVSGGIWGLKEGYGMMAGGAPEIIKKLTPIFKSLAPGPDRGWGHMGPNGAGHFVKMVHNGIEYGMMQAYAEGFALMRAKDEFDLDLHQVAEVWRYGTVIRSWLLDLTARALESDQDLKTLEAWVDDSGEGRWTVLEAVDLAVPVPVITEALFARFRSRRPENYADKLLAAMRHQFGGHAVKSTE
ncbi:MAG: decarboxylating 6-phosphogluconate dehydrogenase [Anaerolineales bacterium]|jgi:6-phosphogluconate dehydrogenase